MKIRTLLRHILTPIPGGKWLMDLWRKGRSMLQIKLRQHRLQKHGLEILQMINYVFANRPEVMYHVDYGTLLGVVRENDFIKHDDDLDFSVYAETITPQSLYDIMTAAGFEFLRGFRYNGVVTELAFTYKKVSVDFFYVFEDKKGNYSQAYNDFRSDSNGDRAYFAERIAKPILTGIMKFDFKGIEVNLPINKEEFLQYAYGKGWKIPVKNWTREDDDSAKRETISGYAEILHTL